LKDFQIGSELPALVDRMVDSYGAHTNTSYIDRAHLPNRKEIVELLRRLLELVYPGFIGRQHLTEHNVSFHVGDLLPRIGEMTFRQIHSCLCYIEESGSAKGVAANPPCERKARELTMSFLKGIPDVRDRLADDVEAAYDGDPAALNTDEVILAYPGLLAVSVYRLAHALYQLDVPIMPRVMTEWAHTMTGTDIHPGAKIGRRFFVDHATGVVIGETTDIGDNVKIYQGVTLGALSFPKDERGRVIRQIKRHPTVKDNVTIYANAIVLGGETVLGESSVIGGSVFLTASVPDNSVVTFTPPELRVKDRTSRGAGRPKDIDAQHPPDHDI